MNEDKILSGKEVAKFVKDRVKIQVEKLKEKGVMPKLTVVLVGEDPASQVYVRMKGKACESLGIISNTILMEKDTSEEKLLSLIDELNRDKSNHGILVQLPLPKQIDEQKVIEHINPKKDVDCFHPHNVGLLVNGSPYVQPCTPAGVVEILKYYKIETEGKHVVVVGRSNIVGKPAANLLIQKNKFANATVTVAHSRTKDLPSITKQADILIAAMGVPQFIKADMLSPDCTVIDVGTNRIDADNEKGYRLVGDVDFDNVAEKVKKITPVPGGGGPMTIAMLMQNTVTVAADQNGLDIDAL
jgi:methylenetetrahydrofolate dehydrogenase (NADP+)/methenyltetrahydrofolate cyclohydrolase